MIYITSPYSYRLNDVMEARFKITEACTAFWMRQSLPVFSPIVHCRQIALIYDFPLDYDYWQRMNHAWIDASRHVWVLDFPNWKVSKGVAGEIEHAENTSKEVTHFTWDEIKTILWTRLPGIILKDSIKLLETL